MPPFGFDPSDAAQSLGSGISSLTSSFTRRGAGDFGGGGFLSGVGNALGGVGGFLRDNFTVGNAVGLALTAGSIAYQAYSNRKIKKKIRALQEQNRGVTIRTSPASGNIPICYGYTAVEGKSVYAVTSRVFPSSPGELGSLKSSSGVSKFLEYLMSQYVICADEIDAVLDLYINDVPYTSDGVSQVCTHEFLQSMISGPGEAFVNAAEVDEDRSAAAGFKLAHITGFYRYDEDDPIFGGGIPRLLVFLRGRKIRAVSSSSITSGRTFHNSSPLVLLDYMTDNIFGMDQSDSDINTSSWSSSHSQSGTAVQGAGGFYTDPYPSDLNTLNGTSYTTWAQYFTELGLTPSDSGFTGWHGVNLTTLNRHEFNGNLLDPGDRIGTLNEILQTMPGADLFRSFLGQWKLVVPERGNRNEATQAGSKEINEDHILAPVAKSWPNTSTRLNQAVVQFNNALNDFSTDTITWPLSESTAHTKLKEEDGNLNLVEQIYVDGVNNIYHASSVAYSTVMQSRRPRYSIVGIGLLCLYEPGDIVKLVVPTQGIDEYIKIGKVTLTISGDGSLETSLEAIQFVATDYAMQSMNKQDASLVKNSDFSILGLRNVGAIIDSSPKVRQLVTEWSGEDTIDNVVDYLVEYAEFDNPPKRVTPSS